jgi:hypothetical protein
MTHVPGQYHREVLNRLLEETGVNVPHVIVTRVKHRLQSPLSAFSKFPALQNRQAFEGEDERQSEHDA